jgi:hypothetical protein
MIEKFEVVLVGKLNDRVLQRTNLLEHLTGYLRIKSYCAMLELVERRVKSFVDVQEFFLHSLNFRFILNFSFLKPCNFLLNFC